MVKRSDPSKVEGKGAAALQCGARPAVSRRPAGASADRAGCPEAAEAALSDAADFRARFDRRHADECGAQRHGVRAHLRGNAQETSRREDNRRVSNGDQVNRVAALALKRGKSVDFTGYWQRHIVEQ
jgi:hypothetical protein